MMFGKTKFAVLLAEFLGVALLTSTVLVLAGSTAVTFFIAISAAIALGVAVALFGPISGGHINPAITLALWTMRRISSTMAIAYVVAQLLGGLAAWGLYEFLSGSTVDEKSATFTAEIWLAELVGTAILAMGVAAAVSRGLNALQSGAIVGLSLFLGVMIAGVASAGILNPAVALGLRSWGSAYVLGPLLGAVIGANLYMMFFAEKAPKK